MHGRTAWQLFYGVTIPCCLWFFAKNKNTEGFRNRKGEVLFIDARKLGTMVDRVRRDFSNDDVAHISDTYHAWRGQSDAIERVVNMKTFPAFAIPPLWKTLKHMAMC